MKNREPENRVYEHLTEQLAQQFADSENVDADNLAYLRNSDESRLHYSSLMD